MEDPRETYYQRKLQQLDGQWACLDASRALVVLGILHTYDCMHEVLSAELQRFGLSSSAYNLLTILDKQENQCLALHEIGRLMVTSRANITGLIDSLCKKGLVDRVPHESDRRIKLAKLLPAGRRLLQEVTPIHIQLITQLTATLSDEERAIFVELMKKLRKQAVALGANLVS
ncbi:MAG: MarR family transcriptional regulator [Candidatus Eremiobacteraeota bacterium]|nr:MarR family transcriptional regulator [Candidatus Eremiobacteraeota bacterium]MCW5866578.1 MarR family transcriptional regulator [Candidatus Eremiobacteraeota bacterium]